MDQLVICDYCQSTFLEGELKCTNCGAPIGGDSSALPDFRSCPKCHRKLLALGSPACSYCGRRLPDEYIKAREADLKRITDVGEKEGSTEPSINVGEFFRQTRGRRNESSAGLVDITSLIDFFS